MVIRSERWLDRAIGETREVLVENGRPTMLRVARWSDAGRRARWGEVYVGRVRRVEARMRGAFVDLGVSDQDAFWPFGASRPDAMTEGAILTFQVVREAARDKGAVVRPQSTAPAGAVVGRIARHDCDADFDEAAPCDPQVRARIDAVIEDCLARQAVIPGGGLLTIEPTAALVAIDVDAAQRSGERDADRFAFALNSAAALEALRHLRLRSLGGVIAIDFVSMRRRALQTELEDIVKAAANADPWGLQMARLSRFGVMELQRAQLRTPLHEVLCGPDGTKSAETIALEALRRIEAEMAAARGRKIEARLPAQAMAFLEATPIGWRAALEARIGCFWAIAGDDSLGQDRIDVRAV